MALSTEDQMWQNLIKQRELNKAHRRARIAQATGGLAGTLRGESAPEAFAKRAPDYSGQTMTDKEKAKARLGLFKHEESVEQYYYTKAQQKYLKELEQEMQNRRAILAAETAKMNESGKAARARAANRRLELGNRITEDVARGKAMVEPSRGLIRNLSEVKGTEKMPGIQERADKSMAKYLNGTDKKQKEWKKSLELEESATDAQVAGVMEQIARAEWDDDIRSVKSNVKQAAISLMLSGDSQPWLDESPEAYRARAGSIRNDIVNGIPIMAKKANLSTEELLGLIEPDIPGSAKSNYQHLQGDLQSEQQELLLGIQKKQVERAKASVRTYGSTGGMGVAQQALVAPARARMAPGGVPQAQAPQAPGGVPQAQAPGGVPQAQAPGEPGAAEAPGFMGLPGVKQAGSSQARTAQMFDIIENFPKHPPAQEMKNQIIAGQGFKDYKLKHFGENAPDAKVWGELKRDLRLKQKVSNMDFRKSRSEKRLIEMGRPLREDRKPKVPVQGATGAGGTDVDTA